MRRRNDKYIGLSLADYCLESCSNYDLIALYCLFGESTNIFPPQKGWKVDTFSIRSISHGSHFFLPSDTKLSMLPCCVIHIFWNCMLQDQ